MVEMVNGMTVRENMKNKTSIEGWGVVPTMAPSPSQGGSTLRGRERCQREREREREREMVIVFIHSP